jgi:hypothetical protein
MSRSPVCFVISRGVSSGPWIIDAYSGLRPTIRWRRWHHQGAAATFVACSESGSEMLSCKSCRELSAKPESRSVLDDDIVRDN